MALRAVPRKAVGSAAVLLGAAASSDDATELSAAPPSDSLLEHSKRLLHLAIEESKGEGEGQGKATLINIGKSEAGHEWYDVTNDLHDLVELSASVASDPTVQRAIDEKLQAFPWANNLATSQIVTLPPEVTPSPSDEEKLSVCSDFETVSHHFGELKSENELLHSVCEKLQVENARLRELVHPALQENMPHISRPDNIEYMPHEFLFSSPAEKLPTRPAVARVQELPLGC